MEGDSIKGRIAFGPEALSRFTTMIEEVASELVGDGVPASQMHSTEMRTRLAQRLLAVAHSWWTDTQIKQLLLRRLRNEASAARVGLPDADMFSVEIDVGKVPITDLADRRERNHS